VDGSVNTPDAPEPGVPVQDPAATLNNFIVALATPVPTTTRRNTPAVPFTAVVAAVVMFVPEDPASASRPELSVNRERMFDPSEPADRTFAGSTVAARKLALIVPLVNALALTLACDAPPEHLIVYDPFAETVAACRPVSGRKKNVATHVVPPS